MSTGKMVTEQTIQNTLQSLLNGLDREKEQKYSPIIQDILKDISKSNLASLKNPEMFFFDTNYVFENILEVLIKKIYDNLDENNMGKMIFLYNKYEFFELQLTYLIKYLEGGICSHDKVCWIIGCYLKYLNDGTIIQKSNDNNYYEPKKGTVSQWMHFCDKIQYGYYGKMDVFLEEYQTMLALKNEV